MLTERRRLILSLIVDDYIQTAAPVASDAIVRNHELGVSPATVRNDVAQLEEEGYLSRPHPSAGTIPMDKAYRLYVESLPSADSSAVPGEARRAVRRQLEDAERDVEVWTEVAAAALADLVGNMAVTTFPKARNSRVKHLEFVYLQEFMALLVLVLGQARLRRHLVRLSAPVQPGQLEATTFKVRQHMVGRTRREVEALELAAASSLESELIGAAMMVLVEEERAAYTEHYVNGLRNLLGQPEFATHDRARAVVEGVEDGTLIQAALGDLPQGHVMRVIIGKENQDDFLSPFSVVLCQYGIPGEAEGVMGVLGPTRMHYPRTIGGIRYMSSLMSELVLGLQGV